MEDEEKLKALGDFAEKLAAEQKPMPPEFAKIIHENFWDLISVSPEVRDARREVCKQCEFRVTKAGVDFCSKCSCFLGMKTKASFADCPEGKWKE